MRVPSLHLNGTSPDQLVEQLANAQRATSDAMLALEQAAPNSRDYYLQGADAFKEAMMEHRVRLNKVSSVHDELTELMILVQDQVDEIEKNRGLRKRNGSMENQQHDGINPAIQDLHGLRDLWYRGGDMGFEDVLIVQTRDGVYAVKIEIWSDDCLVDLKRGGPSAARRRGEALAKQWSKQKWPHTGYEELHGAEGGCHGATWAWDHATEEEIEEVDEDDILIL